MASKESRLSLRFPRLFKHRKDRSPSVVGDQKERSPSDGERSRASNSGTNEDVQPGSLTTIPVEDRSTGSSQTSATAARSSAHDLWSLAFEQLDADKKSVLNFAQAANDADSSSPIDITSVIEQTERSYAAYNNTGWRIRYRNGEEVNVRRRAKNILTSALAFKALIDSAVAFDPSGHAASAWGIVAFGLSLMQNDRDRTEKIFESSAFLASVLLRYRSIETYYLSRPLQDSSQLKKAVIDVYVGCSRVYSSSENHKPNQSCQTCSAGVPGIIRAAFTDPSGSNYQQRRNC